MEGQRRGGVLVRTDGRSVATAWRPGVRACQIRQRLLFRPQTTPRCPSRSHNDARSSCRPSRPLSTSPLPTVYSSLSYDEEQATRGAEDESDHALLVIGYRLLAASGHLRDTVLFSFKELHMSLCHILEAMILKTLSIVCDYRSSRLPFGSANLVPIHPL